MPVVVLYWGQLGCVGAVEQVSRAEHRTLDGVFEAGAIRLARDRDGRAFGGAYELPQLVRLERDIHQRGRRADRRGPEDRGGREEATDVDDRDAIAAADAVHAQRRRAAAHRPVEVAVRHLRVVDDQRDAIGRAGDGRIEHSGDVHGPPDSQ